MGMFSALRMEETVGMVMEMNVEEKKRKTKIRWLDTIDSDTKAADCWCVRGAVL